MAVGLPMTRVSISSINLMNVALRRHNLRVRIEDLAGNVTEKNWVFTRYARAPGPIRGGKNRTQAREGKKGKDKAPS